MAKNRYDDEWLKHIIDAAIEKVLNENKVKETHRALTADDLLQYGIVYVDAKRYNAHDISVILFDIFERIKQEGENAQDFYCGITNDIITRKKTHEQKDYDGKLIEYVIVFQCQDKKTAANTEYIMYKHFGFNIGGTEAYANGAADDSDYVYIYRIPK